MKTGARLGAGRLSVQLNKYGIELSRATTGRKLAKVRRRCPTCRHGGYHDPVLHLLNRDLKTWEQNTNEERARLGLPAREYIY